MSRRSRLIATLLAAVGLVAGLAPAASAQPFPGIPVGSEIPAGIEIPAIETAPVWTPVIPGVRTPVVTVPTPAPPRPAPEYSWASIFPTHNEIVGVAQPVMITFDKPIRDRARAEATIGVRTAPEVSGKFYWISDTEVRWRPHHFWPSNTSVTVWVGGRERVFKTGDAVVSTYDNATKTVTVTRNGHVVRTMPASAGRDAYPTYNGIYYNGWRARKVHMDSSTWGLAQDAGGYDVVVDDGVRLSYDGIFIHSAPWSIADQGHRNVSHGCINVSPENARWYYDNTRNGDPFIVKGTTGGHFGAFDGQGDWNY
ncbi:MAG TPA: L,D-transpeptidase [Actinomycetales bacterium]|nr:L,D-transpeptidase [Actinomycetales bacterium]